MAVVFEAKGKTGALKYGVRSMKRRTGLAQPDGFHQLTMTLQALIGIGGAAVGLDHEQVDRRPKDMR